jgi:hypothetical protein
MIPASQQKALVMLGPPPFLAAFFEAFLAGSLELEAATGFAGELMCLGEGMSSAGSERADDRFGGGFEGGVLGAAGDATGAAAFLLLLGGGTGAGEGDFAEAFSGEAALLASRVS